MKEDSIFPINIQIEDVREAIRDGNDIREFIFDDFVIFSYTIIKDDTFPNPEEANDERTKLLRQLRRECRGIVFSKDGKLLARRFHKFFNINENKESKVENIKFDENCEYEILQKLDGSMISPFILDEKIIWASKKGFSPVEKMVSSYVEELEKKQENKIKYKDFVTHMSSQGFTVIFEWCSPRSPIILKYQQDSLCLVAIRENKTGNYINFEETKIVAKKFEIPLVEPLKLEIHPKSITELIEIIKLQKGIEGK